jgi:hypothetical protein
VVPIRRFLTLPMWRRLADLCIIAGLENILKSRVSIEKPRTGRQRLSSVSRLEVVTLHTYAVMAFWPANVKATNAYYIVREVGPSLVCLRVRVGVVTKMMVWR